MGNRIHIVITLPSESPAQSVLKGITLQSCAALTLQGLETFQNDAANKISEDIEETKLLLVTKWKARFW